MRPTEYRPEMLSIMQEAFADGDSITAVCCKLGICRDTYYDWRANNPEFAAAAKLGETHSQMYWETVGKDGIVGNLDKFAGSSWQFVMKNRFRADYRDEQAVQANNTLIEKLLEKL